jgi:hypothetical protein
MEKPPIFNKFMKKRKGISARLSAPKLPFIFDETSVNSGHNK